MICHIGQIDVSKIVLSDYFKCFNKFVKLKKKLFEEAFGIVIIVFNTKCN